MVAIYERDGSFRKVGIQGSAPKVKNVVSSFVGIWESMVESMVVMFMRAGFDWDNLTLVNARSGQQVVITHISLPTSPQ
jgi:hypothetical protein